MAVRLLIAVDAFAGESQDEMNFFRTLRMEIKKIADFFVQEQATHTSQVVTIEQQFMDLKVEAKSL